jgi:WD40 repeat protein
VFRDQTSLAASPELWSPIEVALSQTRYFVLLASPEAAASHWVDKEVRWWRAHRTHDSVLIVLTDGGLRWDPDSGDFDAAAALPPGLRGWFLGEPLWVDLRWAREERDVSMRNPRFRDAVGQLAAPLHGVPKDELIGEDIRQHHRTIRLARGAVALLVLLLALAVVGGIVALTQRNNARNQAELALAGQVSATSAANLEDRLDVAQLLAAEGYSRRQTTQTTAALFSAVMESPQLAKFVDLGTPVTALVAAPDDETVLAGGKDGTVHAWSVADARVGPALVDLRRPISALASSESGRYLAAGDEAGNVSIVNLRDRSVSRLSTQHHVAALAVADDGRWLAVASASQITLHDLASGAVEGAVSVNGVDSLAFRDRGRTLFAGTGYGLMQRRSVPSLAPVGIATHLSLPAAFDAGGYTADGRYYGFYKFGVRVWSTDTLLTTPPAEVMGRRRQFPIRATGQVSALAIARDASRVAVASAGTVSLVKPPIGFQPGGLVTEPMTGISGQTTFLSFLGSGQRLVSSSGSLLALWDPGQDARIARPIPGRLPDKSVPPFPPGLAVAGNRGLVAWSSDKPEVGLWDPERGRRSLPSPPGYVTYGPVALSADRRYLAAVAYDGVEIWDLARGGRPLRVPGSGRVGSETGRAEWLEPDTSPGSMFAIWDSGRVERLSLGTAQLHPVAAPGDGTFLSDVAFAPEADLGLEVIDHRLSQIDLNTGQRSGGPRLGLSRVGAVGVTPDGRMLAAADGEESAVIWDVGRGQPVRRLTVGRVAHLALSPDGRLMATVTLEGVMSLWDVASGTKLGQVLLAERGVTFSRDRGAETTLGFAPNGDLWTATTGGRVIRWPMSPNVWMRSICRTVNRSLTQAEWERYVGTAGAPQFSCG